MRIVIIGGTGHVGSFLVPRLVRSGHSVVSLSRGERRPYVDDPAWEQVEQIGVDRTAEDAANTFAGRVANLGPEVVIDMLCFTTTSAAQLVEGLRGRIGHLVLCGSIWRYGDSRRIPITEENGAAPYGEYGTQKAAIAELLKQETERGGLVTTSLHPGHISGPGWAPINALGNLDPGVWQTLAAGEELLVPGLGAELMHHVHADDVAQAFELAVERRDAAAGEEFNVVAPSAMTVRGLAEAGAGWFGREANLKHVSWEEFRASTTPEYADQSWSHLARSQYASIDKARRLLGYSPAYEPDVAVEQAVRWLVEHDQLTVGAPLQSS
jgi:nucleoside-diphosphate-sugar epimerase